MWRQSLKTRMEAGRSALLEEQVFRLSKQSSMIGEGASGGDHISLLMTREMVLDIGEESLGSTQNRPH